MKVREVREEDRDDSEVKGKNVVVEDKHRVYKAVVDKGGDGTEVSVTNGVVGAVESAEVHAVIV
jgi:hypothetical protein